MAPSSYLIILAERLPNQSREAFLRELTVVHAAEVAALAGNIGVIQNYLQLVAPPQSETEAFVDELKRSTANHDQADNFPVPILLHKPELASCVMLRYIDEATVRAVFKLNAYREAAAKHVFAEPRIVTMGTIIASYNSNGSSGSSPLSLSDGKQGNFSVVIVLVGRKERTNKDQIEPYLLERAEKRVRAAITDAGKPGATYTLLEVPCAAGSPYEGTPFSGSDGSLDGYMERYSFTSQEDAVAFFNSSCSKNLAVSKEILDSLEETFWYAGVENVVVDYSKQGIGLWLKSQVVSTALALKTILGK